MVKLVLGPNRLKIVGDLDEEVIDLIEEKLMFHPYGYQYSPKYKNHVWDGWIKLFKRKGMSCPVGLYRRIQKILGSFGIKSEVKFVNDYEPKNNGVVVNGLKPFDFQKNGTKLATKHKIGYFSFEPRSGKTVIIGAALNNIGLLPAVVLTKGKILVRQTVEALSEHTNYKIGYLNEGKLVEGSILVADYAVLAKVISNAINSGRNLVKYSKKMQDRNKKILEHIKHTKVLIMDECHHAFSKQVKDTMSAYISVGYKIALSGTPKPDKAKQIETEAVIGPKLGSIGYEKLIQIKRIAKTRIIVYDMPREWYDRKLLNYDDVVEANIVNNFNRNKFIRIIVKDLYKHNKVSFITVTHKQHGFNLNDMIEDSFFVWGGIKLDTRFQVYNSLQKKIIPCIISTVGKEGLNLPKLDAVINAEGCDSRVLTKQRIRSSTYDKDKKFAYLIDFLDKGAHIEDHSESRLKQYEKIKGFEVIVKKVPKNYFEVVNV